MIDLHIHTSNSDGSCSTIEVLKLSQNAGLDKISITDHNNLNAYDELSKIKIKDYYSGEIINGCEIKCMFEGLAIEVLAYDFKDIKNLNNWLEKYFSKEARLNNQSKQLDYLKNVCSELGLRYDEELTITQSNPWAALSLIFNLVKFEENKTFFNSRIWNNPHFFYREYCCSKSSPFYVDENSQIPDINEVIEAVTESGGITFLAHLYEYPIENHESYLEKLLESSRIDGLECYHSTFTNEQIDLLIKFCDENNLLVCGGTDFHGQFKPSIRLGVGEGNLNIPNSIISKWPIRK